MKSIICAVILFFSLSLLSSYTNVQSYSDYSSDDEISPGVMNEKVYL
jgi:hypothetical protein